MLPDGQSSHPVGGGSAAGAVLYEDLPDAMSSHSQLHNHLPAAGHHGGQAPTIEVRNPPAPREPPLLPRRERPPQPHHLDYLDYRDPRSILRVQDKPSRAVLGGYRTPRALLAKSQGVPLSIASQSSPRLGRPASPLLRNESNLLRNSHLLLATQNALITSQRPPSPPLPAASPPLGEFPTRRDLDVGLVADGYPADVRVPARPRDSGIPITPTHRAARRRASPARPPSSPSTGRRRPSVDSEGYSYIDFKDTELEAARRVETANPVVGKRTLRPTASSSSRSGSIDSDGYSYIVDYGGNGRRAPGAARRLVADGTEEEVCPLCTMQQIHHLLSQPEDVYLRVRDT